MPWVAGGSSSALGPDPRRGKHVRNRRHRPGRPMVGYAENPLWRSFHHLRENRKGNRATAASGYPRVARDAGSGAAGCIMLSGMIKEGIV